MISSAGRGEVLRGGLPDKASRNAGTEESVLAELERLRAENRRLAVSLGAFSAFVASKGLLEDAWQYIHAIHQIEESGTA